ncbi:MAG: hypothetical protein KF812_00215 [Fimbriimonadaceae bacterium]|nr:hypothetical protein [Fimbriimonadaceae bacterium]
MATKTLFVGNLPYSTTESDLMKAFEAYGGDKARIIEGRGFGFIDIDEEKLATAIEEMHEKNLGGRNIVVNEAQPRTDRPRNSGGGGSGYGNRGGGGGYGNRGGGGGYGNRGGGGGRDRGERW